MAKKPKGKPYKDGLAENLLFSFMPILFVLIICLGMLCFNKTGNAAEILFQMVTGGDLILCSFAVLLPSFVSSPWERGNKVFLSLLAVGFVEAILYAIFKANSNSENYNLILIVAVSLLCMGISVFLSCMSRERLEEARLMEEPVKPIENAEEVLK